MDGRTPRATVHGMRSRIPSSRWLDLLAPAVAALVGAACVHTQQVRPLVTWEDPGAVTAASVLVIQDATVFAATSTDALPHYDVIVRGSVIEAVRPTGEAPPRGARVVDGRGKTVLPGLVDAHFHSHVSGAPPWYIALADPPHVLEEALYAGITTAHDMGGPLEGVLALRAEVDGHARIGPRMKVAGPLLTAPRGYPVSYIERAYPWPISAIGLGDVVVELHDVEEARRTVDTLADAGVDFIKLALAETPDGTPVLGAELVRVVTTRAHERQLRVVAHIDSAKNAVHAVTCGVDILVHGVHSTPLSDDDADALRSVRGVAPTLTTFERLWQLKHGQLSLSQIEKESVAENLQRELPRQVERGYVLDAELMAWLGHLDTHRTDRLVTNNSKLRVRGVRILVGTDGHGSTASFPAGIHEEMRLLARAGIPNAEILLGATAWPAQMTGDAPRFGTLEPGKDADLLMVDGDPLADIAATERIALIVARGRVVKRNRPPPPPPAQPPAR